MLKIKSILSIVLSTLLLMPSVPVPTASAETLNQSTLAITRLAGASRYETSLKISQNGWTNAANVIIATGSDFPDALSASALSKSKNAPIILTEKDGLSNDAIKELKRLRAANAYLIGGTGVIGTNVQNQLKGLNISYIRFAGTDRYGTSKKIAETIGVSNGIVSATGSDFPDALSIAPIASLKRMPILLSPKSGLDPDMAAFIKGKTVPVSYIIGGTGVLSSTLDTALPNSKRLSGSDRFGTNLKINTQFKSDLNFDTVYLATGRDFPDALSGSALAAKHNAPIILTDKDSISSDILSFIKSKNVKHAVILGGTGVVSQSVESQLNKVLFIQVTSVNLNKTSLTLTAGSSETLMAAISPSNATDSEITWSSSNPSVAAVDSRGKVTGKAPGKAAVTVISEDGGLKAVCAVTVNSNVVHVTSVNLNKKTDTITAGSTDTLTAAVLPSDASDKNVTWSSSDTSVAAVDYNGRVTGIAPGNAVITVTTEDGGFTAACTFTVDGDITSKFTDLNFRNVVYALIGKASTAPILYSDVKNLTQLSSDWEDISDLSGIEYFSALNSFDCSNNYITSMDISHNTALKVLDCDNNRLTVLDISHNTALTSLECEENNLDTIDVSHNNVLTYILCSGNYLKSLDVSKNTLLNTLMCDNNQISSLDVSLNTALTDLECECNTLTALDVTHNAVLTTLICDDNQLKSLNVSQNTDLTDLYFNYNQLGAIDLSHNTALANLGCSENQLNSLDLSYNTDLINLYCSDNRLSSLDLINNDVLDFLDCGNNNLDALDVTHNVYLSQLYCDNNKLQTLDLSSNHYLASFGCTYNEITTLYLQTDTWPADYYNPQYTDSNRTTTSNILAITIKN